MVLGEIQRTFSRLRRIITLLLCHSSSKLSQTQLKKVKVERMMIKAMQIYKKSSLKFSESLN